MKDKLIKQIPVAILLIAVIIIGRIIPHMPNFAPVAAVALFAGFFFRSKLLALIVPVTGMLLADMWFVGAYDTKFMLFVYAGLTLPVVLGPWLRGMMERRSGETTLSKLLPASLAVSGFTFGSAVLFYLISNFGVWAMGTMYPPSIEGLMASYASAIPFFKYTVAGDMTYAALLFGTWAAVTSFAGRARRVTT